MCCHDRRLNRCCRVSVWPDPWWWAVGILESHFLVFKRHPSFFDSNFLCCIKTIVQSIASQVLPVYIRRCFKWPLDFSFHLLRTNGLYLQPLQPPVLETERWGENFGLRDVIDHGFKGQISNLVISQWRTCVLVDRVCWCLLFCCSLKWTKIDDSWLI